MRVHNLLLMLFVTVGFYANAQDITTVEAKTNEVGENLDLEAVASVFGESENLADFEKRLNNPEAKISNLDLNKDGEVDYLRVIEVPADRSSLVTIQAVLGKDSFQDVATIDVERDPEGDIQVQVTGDVNLYGSGYIIDPMYAHPPLIYSWYWGPMYVPYYSPYYYGYYPAYYYPWRPVSVHVYHKNVRLSVNVNHTYTFSRSRRSTTCVSLQSTPRSYKVSVSRRKQTPVYTRHTRRTIHASGFSVSKHTRRGRR